MPADESEGFVEKYDAMYTEAIRLKSFQKWPFGDDSKCSAAKVIFLIIYILNKFY